MQELATLRKQRRLTRRALAEQVGVAPNTLYLWEVGKKSPTFDHLRALAEALEASPEELARIVAGAGELTEALGKSEA